MKTQRFVVFVGIAAVAVGALTAAGCSGQQAEASDTAAAQGGIQSSAPTTAPGGTQTTTPTTAPGGAQTSSSATTQGTGQVLPVAKNPIVNDATKEGLQITAAMAENNVDPATKKDLTDRLQFTIKNTSTETLSDLEVFYQMTDSTTKKTEGYYQKLTGFSLAPGAEGTVYFDNESGPGHYPESKFSLYRTSANEVVISIEVSATGYKPAMGEAVKAVGTGEKAGE
jgi:hypothetical protein